MIEKRGTCTVSEPIIADKNGELARLIQQHGCGIVVAPGDADALVAALRRLSNAPETIAEMGRRARAMLDAHFTRQQALQRWSGLFDQLDKSSASQRHAERLGHGESLMRTMADLQPLGAKDTSVARHEMKNRAPLIALAGAKASEETADFREAFAILQIRTSGSR